MTKSAATQMRAIKMIVFQKWTKIKWKNHSNSKLPRVVKNSSNDNSINNSNDNNEDYY